MQSAAACSANTPTPAPLLLPQPQQHFQRRGCFNTCKELVFGPLMQLWGAVRGMYLHTQPQCTPSPSLNPHHIRDSTPTFFSSLAFCRTLFSSCGTNVPSDSMARERSLQAKEPDEKGHQGRQGRRKELRQPQTWCRGRVCVDKHAGRKRADCAPLPHNIHLNLLFPSGPRALHGALTLLLRPQLSVLSACHDSGESQLSSHIDSGPESVPLNLRPSAANKKWQQQPWPGT